VLFSLLSGALWGGLAYVLGAAYMEKIIWGGVFASPLIGLVVGLLFRWTLGLGRWARVLGALLSLYFAATLFGLAVGLYDINRDSLHRIPSAVVLQAVAGVLWGITFTGYVVILWPLAYLNHRLLALVTK
jgi:hypothetical protein